jgi:hypothetical protein
MLQVRCRKCSHSLCGTATKAPPNCTLLCSKTSKSSHMARLKQPMIFARHHKLSCGWLNITSRTDQSANNSATNIKAARNLVALLWLFRTNCANTFCTLPVDQTRCSPDGTRLCFEASPCFHSSVLILGSAAFPTTIICFSLSPRCIL